MVEPHPYVCKGAAPVGGEREVQHEVECVVTLIKPLWSGVLYNVVHTEVHPHRPPIASPRPGLGAKGNSYVRIKPAYAGGGAICMTSITPSDASRQPIKAVPKCGLPIAP
jgi:hypothetical protein